MPSATSALTEEARKELKSILETILDLSPKLAFEVVKRLPVELCQRVVAELNNRHGA
ncbi:MAG: hypothetical protein ACRD1X_10450 [Vicinamibacteria bacterium]